MKRVTITVTITVAVIVATVAAATVALFAWLDAVLIEEGEWE